MNKMIIQLMVMILSLTTITAASTRIVIYTTDDSYVSGWDPSLNFGSEDRIRVGDGGSLEYRTYLRFDLSNVPAGKTISSASLVLICNLATIGTPVGAHYLYNDGWDESTITWNNAPVDFNSQATVHVINDVGEQSWTITNDVNDAYNNDKIYSMVLKVEGDYSNNWSYFYSKEDEFPFNWPYLEINYEGPKYGGGNGTSDEPFLIYTAEQLNQIGENPDDWDKEFLLMNDINLSQYQGMNFHIISTDWQTPFTGHFNGNGHVISNLNYSAVGVFVNYAGLFGAVGEGGIINDLGLDKPRVYNDFGNGTASLVGVLLSGGTVSRCWASDVCIVTGYVRGGLIGEMDQGAVYDSYVKGGISYYAGLLGDNYGGLIVRCYSTAYTGSGNTGGLVGTDYGGTVIASFWDTQTSNANNSGGGTGKTTAEMQTKSTFTDAGWDFVWETANGPNDVWAICEGVSYPKLAWQYVVGDSDSDKDVDFIDFAPFANKWMQADSTLYCGGIDLTGDGFVDLNDLAAFVENWLVGL
jgi:hypothetical protein